MKEFLKNLLTTIISIIFTLLIVEVILHFYNPMPTRVRGDKIILKTNIKKKTEISPRIEGLDAVVYYSSNSIGFRGEDMPKDFDQRFSIFTVGGSTTECSTLSDDSTWSEQLAKKLKTRFPNVWLNNAGIDGNSTHGHNILLNDYLIRLKPDMIVFLIGINDRGKANFDDETTIMIDQKESFIRSLIKKSELANLVNNLYLRYKTQKVNLGLKLDSKSNKLKAETPEEIIKQLDFHKQYQPKYKARVQELVTKCKVNGIIPVLVSQNLAAPDSSSDWQVLEIYNATTRQVALANGIPFIDLAHKLEKKPEYFFDDMHYSNEGAEVVSQILFYELSTYIVPAINND